MTIPEECPYCAGDPRLPATRAGIGCHDPFNAYDLVELRMQARRPCADEVSSLVQSVRDHAATMRKLADVEAQRDEALATIARVEAIHVENPGYPCADFKGWCEGCSHQHPCATVRALADPEGGT